MYIVVGLDRPGGTIIMRGPFHTFAEAAKHGESLSGSAGHQLIIEWSTVHGWLMVFEPGLIGFVEVAEQPGAELLRRSTPELIDGTGPDIVEVR